MNRTISGADFIDSFFEDDMLKNDELTGSEDNNSIDSLPMAPLGVPIYDEPGRMGGSDADISLDSLPLAPNPILGSCSAPADENEVDISFDSLPLASSSIIQISSVPDDNEVDVSLDSLPLASNSMFEISSVPIDDELRIGDERESINSLDSLLVAPSTTSRNYSLNETADTSSKGKGGKKYSYGPTQPSVKRFAPPNNNSTPKKHCSQGSMNDEILLPCTMSDDSVLQSTWSLCRVLNVNGCKEGCALKEHELTEHDILSYHCAFDSKTSSDQNDWLIQYFATHCPFTRDGSKDVKNIVYIVNGKTVCLKLWMEILPLSTSRCYRLRRLFLDYGDTTNAVKQQKSRSLSPKTSEALTWMEHYFNKIGDKRPDKNSILLPTCLTEKRIHEIMLDQLYQGDQSKGIWLSQFNKLYRLEFKNVTIPKVCIFVVYVVKFVSLYV